MQAVPLRPHRCRPSSDHLAGKPPVSMPCRILVCGPRWRALLHACALRALWSFCVAAGLRLESRRARPRAARAAALPLGRAPLLPLCHSTSPILLLRAVLSPRVPPRLSARFELARSLWQATWAAERSRYQALTALTMASKRIMKGGARPGPAGAAAARQTAASSPDALSPHAQSSMT